MRPYRGSGEVDVVEQQHSKGTGGYDAASAVAWFVGISQGLVPLVVAGVFGRDGRFALPLLLPPPWWWLASIAVVLLALAALVLIDTAKERAAPTRPAREHEEPEKTSDVAAGFDALSGLVLLVGVYNGLAPFVSRLLFDGDLFLAFTLRLPAPWWWIASLAVLALTVVLLELVDRAKKRSTGVEES